jgi:hypothetical protein
MLVDAFPGVANMFEAGGSVVYNSLQIIVLLFV